MFVMVTNAPSTGIDVSLHTELDDAIAAARTMAVDLCRHDDSYNECEIKGLLFHVEFSCEGGYCYVVEKEVN